MKGLLLITLLWASPQTQEFKWERVAEMKTVTLYFERETVSWSRFPKAWFRTDFKQRQKGGTFRVVSLTEFDCVEHRIRTLQATTYSRKSKPQSVNGPLEWQEIQPDTTGAAAFKKICRDLFDFN